MKTTKQAKVKVENGYIKIKIPSSLLKEIQHEENWGILDQVKGMWKHRKIDALNYQKKIRSEWK